ncbi:MAG: 50S ribosomal protein L3 [Ignavibacteria bacterium]|jgi:large subunit ribosomal protein L3|nr:MAG: 50S ribosomal protein L3 [Ignavibacteria bacterium]
MAGLLGKKIGMTSIFNTEGNLISVTVIKIDSCKVVNIRTNQKDGYEAVQLGYGSKKEKNVNKPLLGYYKSNKLSPFSLLKEFKNFDTNDIKIGDEFKVDFFSEGEKIKVRNKTIGRGFQGVIKRHGFAGVGGTTHGQSNRLRAPGSIGQSSSPSRVFKGHKMAGRVGNENVTISNLEVIKVNLEESILMIKGAIPGPVNSIVELIKN